MVFSSITFLYIFLPITLLVYYLVPAKAKNWVLFVSGLVFYAWGEPVYVFIMILSTLIDYTAGRLMDFWNDDEKRRKILLICSVAMNLGLLAVFKYSSFIIDNINALFHGGIPDPQLPLPIGISFFTFQSMSYTIDLYRRQIKVQKNFINFGAYVTMFPQIVAGPIVRYQDVSKELESRSITVGETADGIGLFTRGLAKKLLLANNIGLLWAQVREMPIDAVPAATAWLGILAFAFQIYFDFSGYSDMACGIGKMLGFHFPQNFNLPYTAKSITDFWRRWHITLSTWFKEYLYIPLGGNRSGTVRTIRNLLIVWVLTGFWHGASWNFVCWGLYFGVLLVLERFVYGKILNKLPSFVRQLYTFVLVVFSWVLFEMETLGDVGRYLQAMFGGAGFADSRSIYLLRSYFLLFLLCIFASGSWGKKVYSQFSNRWPARAQALLPVSVILLMAVCTAYLVNATYNSFLYFRF
ncbi:MBOAT family protein [Clostridiaceae bacterium NSJ-33]|uniref:MBOAT family protein n=1 Tax=Fumia xinanensis TaxID=2763659 RepID=A0A926E297_9FIRM|nr:MBOAT family protein [Fumia xinanensis]